MEEFEYHYNSFTIGECEQFGVKVWCVRPSEYAHEMWGEDHGDEYGELGQDYWADVHSLEDAKATIDALVTDLETREVA